MTRFLVVSPDAGERAALAAMARGGRAEAAEAATYAAAAELLAKGGWDAVVADLAPDAGLAGRTLFAEARARGDRTPFVLAIAQPDVDLGLELSGEPALGLLLKPAGPERLATALRRAGVPFGSAARALLCCACGETWTLEQARTGAGKCAKCGDAKGAVLVPVGAESAPGGAPAFPDGRYVLTHLLGRTGFSEVWAGWQPSLRRRVVVKFASVEAADDVARFKREARLQAGLRHPGIPAVYEAVTDPPDGGRMYLALEYVDGVPLDEAVRAATRTPAGAPKKPLRLILDLLRQSALALDHIHRQKLVHRDVKPENLLASPDGHVWLIDYGLAKRQDASTQVTANLQVLGTLPFMAPEQIKAARDLDARVDVWALGVLLYYLLTWRFPFLGSSIKEVGTAILKSPPPPLDPDVPAGVGALVAKALEKKREDRWAGAGAMAAAIEAELKKL